MGGAAILMSNKPAFARSAKFQLEHTVRVHQGASDTAYEAVFQMEDPQGNVGVRLSKQLVDAVGEALRVNLTRLGPLILPLSYATCSAS